jgi:ArsR family transcriptional regulator
MKDSMKILKALSDETRFNIVKLLVDGERCVCEIFPKIKRTQSTVSIHLGKLESSGVLKSRREGKRIYYSIKNLKIKKILKVLG